MPVDPQLINVFGDDLGDILTALEEGLNPQVQQLLAESLGTLQFDARIFADQIEKRVSMLAGAGMDEAAIRKILHDDLRTGGRIFGELRNNIKGGMVQSINQTGRAGQMEAYKPTEILAWVTVGGHKVCPDCDGRAGQTGTIEFWESNGLPGSGWSVCQGFCYCILDPTGKIDKIVKAPPKKIKPEKGATIRKPKKLSIRERLKRRFTSQKKDANEHFTEAFSHVDEKIASAYSKMPELRHISHNSRGGYFTEYNNVIFRYVDKNDMRYQNRHGGINIKTSSRANMKAYKNEYGTIRHEYGHFMHHNLHPYVGKMNEIYYLYHDEIAKGLSTSVDDFADAYNLNKQARDHLKLHVAYYKDRDMLGVGSKWGKVKRSTKKITAPKTDKLFELQDRVGYLKRNPLATEAKAAQDLAESYAEYEKWGVRKGGAGITNAFKNTDDIIQALLADETNALLMLEDLFGAVTKNKIGMGHANSYYAKTPTMALHETMANLNCLYTNENPAIWNWLKNELPELTKYFEELIEDLAVNDYWGVPMNEGLVGLETFRPPII